MTSLVRQLSHMTSVARQLGYRLIVLSSYLLIFLSSYRLIVWCPSWGSTLAYFPHEFPRLPVVPHDFPRPPVVLSFRRLIGLSFYRLIFLSSYRLMFFLGVQFSVFPT